MFERYTDRARRAVVLAQDEARMLNHTWVGTEHLLLGLIGEGDGVAAKALESLGISLAAVRQQVEEIIGRGQQVPILAADGGRCRALVAGRRTRPGERRAGTAAGHVARARHRPQGHLSRSGV